MAFPRVPGFVVVERLGAGSYSTVYKAYAKVGARSVVAIKCVDKSRLKHSESAVDNLITEIRLLKTLQHPHIVQMKDFSWDDKHIFIVTEYCAGGDLSKYIKRWGRIPERQVLFFLQQLASALKFLRDKGIAHMDLKPHNLLLNKSSEGKYTLKVADFGFAQYMSSDTIKCSVRGSPLYMAPEMLTGETATYDASVDLWSVGVIMYECLFGKAPYSSTTFKELLDKITSKKPIEIPPHSSISAECQDLLTRLLQHDPARRITHEEFFSHQYLDLQHMPSRENYDKAVNLIKRAVDADTKRQFAEAFELYCESLRYLVPVVNSESDSVRRSALRAKVSRYMQRAEELKSYNRCPESPTSVPSEQNFSADARQRQPTAKQRTLMGCFTKGQVSSNSLDFDQPKITQRPKNNLNLCNCTNIQVSNTNTVKYTNGCSCDENTQFKTKSRSFDDGQQENSEFAVHYRTQRMDICDNRLEPSGFHAGNCDNGLEPSGIHAGNCDNGLVPSEMNAVNYRMGNSAHVPQEGRVTSYASNTQSVEFDRVPVVEIDENFSGRNQRSSENAGNIMPYLDDQDMNIVEEIGHSEKPKKMIFGETHDRCRIQ